MYGIFTYIWLIFMVNVGKYARHGSYGLREMNKKYCLTQAENNHSKKKQPKRSKTLLNDIPWLMAEKYNRQLTG